MAKRRSSLKGNDPENSGSSEEKGKGIDLLFGGPPAVEEDPEIEDLANDVEPVETETETGTESPTVSPPPPPAPPTPVAMEAPPADLVDELGLPVAMEAPPADLELAVPDLEDMPVAMETPPTDLDLDTADFADMPVAMERPPADLEATLPDIPDSAGEADIPTEVDDDLSALADDLAGLDDDLTGLSDAEPVDLGQPYEEAEPVVIPAPPISSPSPPTEVPVQPALPVEPIASMPSISPPPVDVSPPPAAPSTPSVGPSQPATPATASTTYGPATSTPPPNISPARVESIGGIISEKIQVVEKDILPEDSKFSGGPVSNVLALAERAPVEQNELITQKVTRYIGRERREKLDKDIESLYSEVATELSVNTADAEFALRTLSQAQDIIFEDARQYDEALYRVAVIRTMIERRRNLRRWSYTWGTAIFFYAVVWLGVFITGFLFTGTIGALLDSAGNVSESVQAVRAAWFSALAGGVGGVSGILYSLYWHVAIKQDFDRQRVMYYAAQPIMGFILGSIIYFIIGAGFIVVNFASDPAETLGDTTASVLSSAVVIALQIVMGWIAGFRMRFVLELVDKIVQRFSPERENLESEDPVTEATIEGFGKVTSPPGS